MHQRDAYRSVAEAIRHEIDTNPEVVCLPTVSALMETYRASRGLITRALKLLQREGVVTSVQGAGWHVVRRRDDARSLTDRMRDVLTEDELAPGSTFPSEAELCARFGRSRTAVRTALAELEGAGLLERAPGRRRIVRAER